MFEASAFPNDLPCTFMSWISAVLSSSADTTPFSFFFVFAFFAFFAGDGPDAGRLHITRLASLSWRPQGAQFGSDSRYRYSATVRITTRATVRILASSAEGWRRA